MPYDFKKEQRSLYLPKTEPEIIRIPPMRYLAVAGRGDPNAPDGDYQRAIGVLYAVAYTLRMSAKGGRAIEGFFDYVVPPLEGFWRQSGADGMDDSRKADLEWLSVIRAPDFVSAADVDWAKETAARKKSLDCSALSLTEIDEGLCVQLMHIGPYDAEPASVARMDRFLEENGYAADLTDTRLHHEIYLSDPRRVAPERRKTVLRHPVKKL